MVAASSLGSTCSVFSYSAPERVSFLGMGSPPGFSHAVGLSCRAQTTDIPQALCGDGPGSFPKDDKFIGSSKHLSPMACGTFRVPKPSHDRVWMRPFRVDNHGSWDGCGQLRPCRASLHVAELFRTKSLPPGALGQIVGLVTFCIPPEGCFFTARGTNLH